jgi:multiple sugar transport system permease protein
MYMFAPIMIIIPLYVVFCLPFWRWLLRSFFQSIPLELEEATLADGAGRGRAVSYIMLP